MSVSTVDDFWERVFPCVASKAVVRDPTLAARINEYAYELRRFLALACESRDPLAMISPRIDSLWHEFVNHTIIYREYCQCVAGRFLDHMPRSEWFPIPDSAVRNFLDAYEARFRTLPDVWFHGLDSVVESELVAGRIPAGLQWSGYVPDAG